MSISMDFSRALDSGDDAKRPRSSSPVKLRSWSKSMLSDPAGIVEAESVPRGISEPGTTQTKNNFVGQPYKTEKPDFFRAFLTGKVKSATRVN